jgi:hypothetical protein
MVLSKFCLTSCTFLVWFSYQVTTLDLLSCKRWPLPIDHRNVSVFCVQSEECHSRFETLLIVCSLAVENTPCVIRHVSYFHLAPQGRSATEAPSQTLNNMASIRCCYVPQCCTQNMTKIRISPSFFGHLQLLLLTCCSPCGYFSPKRHVIGDGMV